MGGMGPGPVADVGTPYAATRNVLIDVVVDAARPIRPVRFALWAATAKECGSMQGQAGVALHSWKKVI